MFDSISRPLFQDQRGHMMRNDRVLREVERNPPISPRSTRSRTVAIVLSSLILFGLGGCVGAGSDNGKSYCVPGPQITGVPSTSATVGVQYVYDFTASYACGLFMCYDADGIQLPPGATIDHYYDMVTWTPTADYANKDVRFAIATPPDNCLGFGGNSATQSWIVHVEPAPPDQTIPYILSTAPTNSATTVPANTTITVLFSEPVSPATINASSYFVTGPTGPVTGTMSVNSATAAFKPSANLSYLSNYTVTVTAAVKDLTGNPLQSDYVWSFTTGSAPDTIAPSTPSSLVVSALSSSMIALSWDPSADNVGIAGYNVYRDGSAVQSVPSMTAIDQGLYLNTRYCFTVSAYDIAGNESLQSGTVCEATLDLPVGSIGAWGYNGFGQLGDGTTITRYVPFEVMNITDVVAVSAGDLHSLAVKSDGSVWAWGWNFYSQLGDFTTINRYSPVQAIYLSDIISVAAGGYHSLALKSDGTVWKWGEGPYTAPTKQNDLSNIVAIAAGKIAYSLALGSDGTVWAWGANGSGQLGDGTFTSRSAPVQLLSINTITAIAAGGEHSLALRSDGSVWAWGSNSYGQLGDGTTTDKHSPVQVPDLSQIIAIAAGGQHSLAVNADGPIWAWGRNDSGQLGDGTKINRPFPVQVLNISDITAVAAGSAHSLARKSDGTVWAWGNNYSGQLGNSAPSDPIVTPVQIMNLDNITAISASGAHSMVLR